MFEGREEPLHLLFGDARAGVSYRRMASGCYREAGLPQGAPRESHRESAVNNLGNNPPRKWTVKETCCEYL
jgi:hypothetical protein